MTKYLRYILLFGLLFAAKKKGKIKTDTLNIEGSAEGDINVRELLKLMSSSYVSGKINYGSIQINEGGKIIGEFEFKDKNMPG